ncbi:MAG: glycosyltransferase, partial [Desulfovibrio sp.]|nr:glycosyltransferase [Desulfovibrio sp.]
RAGYVHVVADDCIVFHERAASFKKDKTELLEAGRAVIDRLYPEYGTLISCFSHDRKLDAIRYAARLALTSCHGAYRQKARILFVTATKTGGTPQTNQDLMTALDDRVDCYLLNCDSRVLSLSRLKHGIVGELFSEVLPDAIEPYGHVSARYDELLWNILVTYAIDIVHVRHMAWHSLNLFAIARSLYIRTVFSLHDYYMISPNLKLIDNAGDFCGDQFIPGCQDYIDNVWPQKFPLESEAFVHFWQERNKKALSHVDEFVTTSLSARELFVKRLSLPEEKLHVIPHGRSFAELSMNSPSVEVGKPIRLLVLGDITPAKGSELVRQLVLYDRENLFEFHVLGKMSACDIPRNIKVYGAYDREDISAKLAAIRPHFGVVFSIWDETYCHTLTEMWASGIPTIALNFPNVAARTQESGCGWVIDYGDVPQVYEALCRIALDAAGRDEKMASLARWQREYLKGYDTALMAQKYYDLYKSSLRGMSCPLIAVLKINGNATYFVRLASKTVNALHRNVTYLHVNAEKLLFLLRHREVDGILLQRDTLPEYLVEEVIGLCQRNGISLIYDVDDDLLQVPANVDANSDYARHRKSVHALLAAADLVIVSTKYLTKRLKKECRNITVHENRIPAEFCRNSIGATQCENELACLYYGTATHDEDLAMVLPALDALHKRYPQFKLYLVDAVRDVSMIRHRPWVVRVDCSHAREYPRFLAFLKSLRPKVNFGIVPLQDTTFTRSKSHLKLLEMAALGLKCVVSNVPAYADFPRCNKSVVFTDNSVTAWEKALEKMVSTLCFGETNVSQELKECVAANYVLTQEHCAAFDTAISMTVGRAALAA